ncbi:MAG: hypothetical protein BMS9Abin22_540 [Gammaproteobacteria bacterium]|nr:MAG: hypothetical protein BMS9Abin22_540 [Gammaproteobacteria bacterium]
MSPFTPVYDSRLSAEFLRAGRAYSMGVSSQFPHSDQEPG